jgi:hypothetical protein
VLHNPHPAEILLEEFLRPMQLSQTALAGAIGVPPRRISATCHVSACHPRACPEDPAIDERRSPRIDGWSGQARP